MDQQQCPSCDGNKSIYGHVCSDCSLLMNGCIKEDVMNKSEEALKRPKRRKKEKILSTLDILISLFVVTPLVVAVWRGTWGLMDVYAEYFPPWESFLLGTLVHILIGLSQESFHTVLNKKHSSKILNACIFLLMKLYTIVLNAVTNMHWRGAWVIMDEYFGVTTAGHETQIKDKQGALIFFTVSFLVMFSMKSLRNLNSPPFELCLDYGDDMFLFPNMFKVKASDTLTLYVLDVIFSVGVVTNLGVIVWKGFWLLLDLYCFPSDIIVSSWACLFLGYLMVGTVFLLQPMMKKFCDNLSGFSKLLVADAYIIFSVIGVIIVWRGIWDLIDIYFLPDQLTLSCWVTHWIPFVILMCMGCSNSVLVRGVCVDCEEPDGTCVVFPCYYLRVILNQEKNDTWFSIWSGTNKTKKKVTNKIINLTNYHIVQINEKENESRKNNNVERGIS